MSGRIDPDGTNADDRQAEQWLSTLRDGLPDEKAGARRSLAAHFESLGMVAEAIDLLVANARAGYRDVEGFQALARLYRAQGNEYLAASAALEATRLSGRRQPPQGGVSRATQVGVTDRASSRTPWGQDGPRQASSNGSAGPRSRPGEPGTAAATDSPDAAGVHAAWRRPLRIVGWLAVVVTVLAALGVSTTSARSAGLYLVSAVVLGVLLGGSQSARGLLRLPAGPLGDGALLFGWLLLLLVAGAILPRLPGSVSIFTPAPPVETPGLYRTPAAPTMTTPAATLTPSPSPAVP
jgi:hypothetical protein